ncbi:hypothetical protein [Chitinophaga sp. GbtcB8]|uniref:hypothetical protein n=1 Tax=Chitinophaga sp. GbtcB8 TaxID=2824753 RepID=UPI001C2FC3CF|nr:hypothetical protein [Chitinophaga sp. GbtcB8]
MLTYFPLSGITPFLDTDKPAPAAGGDTAQFITALPVILNKALRNQVLITPWDSLWVITPADFEQQVTGGQTLLPVIDPGTNLRLCYAQWAGDDGKETNQALVFGRVKGEYKLCGITWKGGIY